MSPLTHKLLRDLWRMKGQAMAIALVIAMGVMLLVMMTGLVNSLEETRDTYYERYRLAEIFAPVARAPNLELADLAKIPGVSAVEGRVNGAALIEIEGRSTPVQAQAVSLPDFGSPALNDIYLTDGRMLDSDRSDEILLLESFADAHGLLPGDHLEATMNGARRDFHIVGLAQSPEFIFTTAPGELVPDDARFGVIWMSSSALSAAYDLDGAFNEALIGLSRTADKAAVLAAVDRQLAAYGATGAYGREDHLSDLFITQEVEGLQATNQSVPPIFLAVAAFLLYIVIGRMVESEREEIGLMKAFGYTNWEVGAHYFRLVLAIAAGGALLGCIFGVLGGRAMVGVYTQFYKFPFLIFDLDASSFLIGVGVSIAAASAGGVLVLRRVFALTPSEAMRPPAPADYSRTGQVGHAVMQILDQPTRMVLRRITRQPLRMAGAAIGIACGMALSASMITIYAGFSRTIDLTFTVIDRSDVSVSFTHAVSDKTILEMQRRAGVLRVEPVRDVPVVLRKGLVEHRGAITGMVETASLSRALDAEGSPIPIRSDGLVLSRTLADILEIGPGESVSVDVREGRQPLLELPVVALADSLLGAPAYMDIGALNRALKEPGRVSGAYLLIDEAEADEIYTWLKDMPVVAGVSLKSEAQSAFERMLNEGAGWSRFIIGGLAFVITFGIVYNAARIAYAERARDLASLRVIGFSKGEAAYVLLGELAAVVFVALPLGTLLGHYVAVLMASAYSTEVYQIPATFDLATYGSAALVVVAAAVMSGLIVKRDLDRADLVAALKTRE
ncbi:MAG: ABC transporter permease [Pseudomonadota bacterium]